MRLCDGTGRLKYFVEVSELRAVRCGAFCCGRRVRVGPPGARDAVVAHVEEFDDESGTYTVRLLGEGAGCRYFLLEDDLREV